jgi:hypothetical protein
MMSLLAQAAEDVPVRRYLKDSADRAIDRHAQGDSSGDSETFTERC